MTECVRCNQPIVGGEYYQHVEYMPKDAVDLFRITLEQEAEGVGWSAQSPYRAHIDCPEETP